jgi:hypothetical protein
VQLLAASVLDVVFREYISILLASANGKYLKMMAGIVMINLVNFFVHSAADDVLLMSA